MIDYEIFDRIASVFFPQRCAFCDDVVAYDDFWCGKCGGGKLPYIKTGRVACGFPHEFFDAVAALEFSGRVRNAIWRLKEKPDARILNFLAGEMLSVMGEYWGGVKFGVYVPVPSTEKRMRQKGFNQAEALALRLSRQSSVPVRGDALLRREDTRDQRGLTAQERRENATRSYMAGNTGGLEGETALLVDDVFTTGSTAAACSEKLILAGVERVYVLTAAWSPLENSV